jgi:hypothetical protein
MSAFLVPKSFFAPTAEGMLKEEAEKRSTVVRGQEARGRKRGRDRQRNNEVSE